VSEETNRALSAGTLAVLQEFYAERDLHTERLDKLKAQIDATDAADVDLSIHTFREDWNESQFWVDNRLLSPVSYVDTELSIRWTSNLNTNAPFFFFVSMLIRRRTCSPTSYSTVRGTTRSLP
jgi:hypothetical protein